MVREARKKALELEEKLRDTYHFYIASEGGIESLDVDGQPALLRAQLDGGAQPAGRGLGVERRDAAPGPPGGGARQRPDPLRRAGHPAAAAASSSSLTGGLETRRKNIALSTFHALSTLFYGVLESRPIR